MPKRSAGHSVAYLPIAALSDPHPLGCRTRNGQACNINLRETLSFMADHHPGFCGSAGAIIRAPDVLKTLKQAQQRTVKEFRDAHN
jgi:hypothetical protein